MLNATKHLIIAGALALAILQPVATYARSLTTKVATVASPSVTPPNAYTEALRQVQGRLDFLEGLLLDLERVWDGVVYPYAGLSVDCKSGQSFHIKVEGGECTINIDNKGDVEGGSCRNDNGDFASATCGTNGGQGSCSASKGSGDCTKPDKK
jgi:hypothetical protein